MYRKCAEAFNADHCGNVNPAESLCCDAFSGLFFLEQSRARMNTNAL